MAKRINIGKVPQGKEEAEKFLWTIPANTTVTAKILVDEDHLIESHLCQHNGKTWAYTGKGDPCEKLGVEPRFSVLVPCSVKTSSGKTYRVVRGPKAISNQLSALALNHDLRGLVVTIERKDDRFAKYTIKPTGQKAAVEEDQDILVADILEHIKQGTADEVAQWLGINTTFTEEEL